MPINSSSQKSNSKIGKSAAADQDSIWLVKSGDKILGPFRTDEVSSKIRLKEVVAIDELASPMSRWRVVRDEPRFQQVIEEMRRGQMSQREDTEVQAQTSSFTQTLTEDQTAGGTGATPTPIVSDASLPIDGSQALDAEFTDSEPTPAWRASQSQSNPNSLRQYGVSYSLREREKKSGFKTAAWVVATMTILGAAGFWAIGRNGGDSAQGLRTFAQLKSDADNAWVQGEFFAALNSYRQADQAKPNRPEIVVRLAPLLIGIEGATAQARRSVGEALNLVANTDRSTRAQLESALGLASLASEELIEAEKHYRKAVATAPNMSAAHFGLGIVAFMKKSYALAVQQFTSAGDDPAALLMIARTVIADRATKPQARKLGEAAIRRVLQSSQDFRQEAQVIAAQFAIETGNKKAAEEHVLEALATDPEMTSEHRHDPNLFLATLEWRSLLPICRKINDELKSTGARALYGLCLFKAGERDSAGELISKALSHSPEEPILLSIDAYMMAAGGRFEDATAELKLATKSEQPRLAIFVRARTCARTGDMACAEQAWAELAAQTPPALAAFTSLAEIRAQQGDPQQAADLLAKAKRMSSNFRPALAFRPGGKR